MALTSAKVPRRGSRKLIVYSRKFCVRVACQQEAGVMNHVYLPAVRAECPQTKVGRGMRSLRVAARIRRCKSNPPARRNRFVGVLKLSGQVECNFQPDFRECLTYGPRKFRESRRTSPPVSGHEANGSSRVQETVVSWSCGNALRVLLWN